RTARLAVVAGCGMRFSRKDPLKRGTGRQDRDGRGPGRTARLAVVAGCGMRFSRKDPMQNLPPGYDSVVAAVFAGLPVPPRSSARSAVDLAVLRPLQESGRP